MQTALIAEKKKLQRNKNIVSIGMWFLRIYVAAFITLFACTQHKDSAKTIAVNNKNLTKH